MNRQAELSSSVSHQVLRPTTTQQPAPASTPASSRVPGLESSAAACHTTLHCCHTLCPAVHAQRSPTAPLPAPADTGPRHPHTSTQLANCQQQPRQQHALCCWWCQPFHPGSGCVRRCQSCCCGREWPVVPKGSWGLQLVVRLLLLQHPAPMHPHLSQPRRLLSYLWPSQL